MTPTGMLQVDGVNLEYRWAGVREAAGPTIVMLHEGLGSTGMWRDFPDRLAERTGCPVFVYSRQGYGRSDKAPARREPDYMHREAEVVLPRVLQAAGVERPILFGHSDGASIALLFAAKYPHAARALVLEAPHVFVEKVTLKSIAEARTAFETTDLPARLGRHHADVEHVFWGWNDIWLDPRFRAWNIEACLAQITAPILLIQGRQDQYGTELQLEAITRRTLGTEALLLDACGHAPHRDQDEAVLRATSQFFAAVEAAACAPANRTPPIPA